MKNAVLLSALIFLFTFCYSQSALPAETYIKTELYFGLSKLDGGKVTEKQWQKFIEEEALKIFADGLTVLNADGAWFDPKLKQTAREKSKLLISIHLNSEAFSKQIDELREKYKKLFNQQSVMRVDENVVVGF